MTTSSRSSLDSSLSPSLTVTGRAGRNPPSSREMDSSSLLLLSSAAEPKRSPSPQEQNRHFAKLLTRSKSKEDLNEGPLQGQPGDKDSPSALLIPNQACKIVDVRTERDTAVDAIAWRVDPTATGALENQPSSADTQQGSSSVVSSVSSDSSNMPPGFISLAANRANAADLIRGRGALRTLPASAQTAGTAVSLLPPQNVAGSNPSLSLQVAVERVQASQAAMRALTQENMHRFQLVDNATDSNLFPPLQASLDRARTALANREVTQTESVNRLQSAIDEGQQRILRNIRGPATEERSTAIGGTVAPSQRLTREREREAARPANYVETVENAGTSAANATSFQEPELPSWDMSTAASRAEWSQARLDARTRFKAEAQAAKLGQVLSPIFNPSTAMLLYYNYLMARRGWEQRQVASSSASHMNTAADLLASSSDGTSGLVIRSANAVADMHWCTDNLGKIRADVGDSKHSDWSDYWEAGYKKTKPWAKNTFVTKRLVLGTNSMWAPFYHSGPDVPDDRDPPHFRVSAELFGRMLHTFGNEYISRDDNRRLSIELDERLNENVAMTTAALNDARKVITDRNQLHLKQHEDMMAQSRQVIEDASLAYRAEMEKQKVILEEHTESCRSMIPGMGVAFSNVRERILSMDVTRRIQLDEEELRIYAELKRSRNSELALKDELAKVKTERDQEKDKAARLADHSRSIISKNEALHVSKSDMEQKIKDLEEKDSHAQSDIATFKRQVRFLKRKRKDNIPPPASHPSPTKILVRPPSPKVATASQASASPARSDSPSLLQPAAKKSRIRKARWDNAPAIPPSDNVSGKGKHPLGEKAKPGKVAVERYSPTFEEQDRLDPVLGHSLTSFKTKHDINAEIDTSSDTLKLGRDRHQVFHRDTVADQVAVTRKALAYAEVIITNSCRNAAARNTRGERRGNDVMAYLDTLSRRTVIQLQKDTVDALENLEDTRRSMAVYQDGPDLQDRIRNACFTSTGFRLQMKASHTVCDLNVRLHERLLIFNQHSIPIGFYYTKWLEKLNFYIGQLSKDVSRNNSPPAKSASSTPVPTPQKTSSSSIASSSAANVTHESMQSLTEKRAAIFDDREDHQLKVKDRSILLYRSSRLVHWVKTHEEAGGSYMTEEEHNSHYDQEQLDLVHSAMSKLNKNTTKAQQNLGDGPAGHGQR
jgi:hypothetical protein